MPTPARWPQLCLLGSPAGLRALILSYARSILTCRGEEEDIQIQGTELRLLCSSLGAAS